MLFSIGNWVNLLPSVRKTFVRFPLPFIFTSLAVLMALLDVHDVEIADDNFVSKCLISLVYGTVASTSIKLLVESHTWSVAKHAAAAIAASIVIVGFVWSIIAEVTASTHAFFSLAIALSLIFAPYIKRTGNPSSVWYFNYQTGVAVFFAVFAALILGGGLSLILVSTGYLFEINFPSEVYADAWMLSWGILFPIYILANISSEFEFEDESCDFPGGIRFIANYLLAPIMLAYMAILYAYFFKIIVQWELPRGNLGWMITSFGTIGIVTRLFAYPIRHSGNRLLMLFDKYYFQALIVPILLLAVAIGIRIREYGITEERYAVVLLGVWFFSVAVLTIVKKDAFHIKFVPMILASLAILASFGPWNAVEVSVSSQTSRFESMLKQYNLLIDGQAVESNIELPFAERKRLSSIADYVGKNKYRLERINPWFTSLMQQSEMTEFSANSRVSGKEILTLLGIDYVNRWQNEPGASEFYYNSKFDLSKEMADVSGFDFVGQASLHNYGRRSTKVNFQIDSGDRPEVITAEEDQGFLNVSTGNGVSLKFDLAGLVRDLRKRNIVQHPVPNLDTLTLTQFSADGSFSARLILEYIKGNIEKSDEVDINQISFVLMVRFND